MDRARTIMAVTLIAAAALSAAPASAEYLVADLSERRITITLGFAGAKVLLFGATDGEGDVAVVVRGPEQSVVVRRKDRLSGIWVNRSSMRFEGVPAFYRVASSRPVAELASPAVLSRHEIGVDHLHLPAKIRAPEEVARPFRKALVRLRQRDGLYGADAAPIAFLDDRLFRTTVDFPATVAPGAYMVEVFLIRDGQVVIAQSRPLFISKEGVSAEIFDAAHRFPAFYGIVAVFCALVAGWLAAVMFRKV